MTKSLLIVLVTVSFIICTTNANYTCFNSVENEMACDAGSAISLLPAPLQEAALTTSDVLVGLVSDLGNSVVQILTDYLSECPINTKNDQTLAKSFNFRLFYPNGTQTNLTGLEFMNRCAKNGSDNINSLNETVYLMHGILAECPSTMASGLGVSHTFSQETAFAIAKKLNALVVLIDWGKSGLSCCNYFELTFCYLDIITDWITTQAVNGAKNGVLSPIEQTTFVGHSMGAQYGGYISQKVFKKTGTKFKKLLGLDPAGPFFANDNISGQCQGIKPDVAEYTMTIQTGIGGLGTSKTDLAMVNVVSNKDEDYCQSGIELCNPVGNHLYSVTPIFDLLANGIPLQATFMGNGSMKNLSIFENMISGLYDLEGNDNEPLKNFSSVF